MSDRILRAVEFAIRAHGDQRRKYTFEPYVMHCLEVARTVTYFGGTEDMVVAAILHDVVEDTTVTPGEIEDSFGHNVAALVVELSDVSRPEDGNRAARKAIDCAHSGKASPAGQTIKVADLISNSKSIVANAPEFAKVYLVEKENILDVMGDANPDIVRLARDILAESKVRVTYSSLNN